jgi:hypothetical protein
MAFWRKRAEQIKFKKFKKLKKNKERKKQRRVISTCEYIWRVKCDVFITMKKKKSHLVLLLLLIVRRSDLHIRLSLFRRRSLASSLSTTITKTVDTVFLASVLQ